jgi:hypothetical protein
VLTGITRNRRRLAMRSVLVTALVLAMGSRAAAQNPTPTPTPAPSTSGHIDFNRPESWAMKYFVAVSTFTAIGPPVYRPPWTFEIGLEAGWIPHLSDEKRRVGFDGTALEDLNKTSILGRPRLLVAFPAGFSLELGWIPPIEIRGEKTNLLAASIEKNIFETDRWLMGIRGYGQIGHVKGDFTCSEDVAAQPPGSPGNPLGCDAPSEDVATLNYAGGALSAAAKIGTGWAHIAGGGTYNDLQFQVGAYENGQPDNTRLTTYGWTGWIAGGVGFPLGPRFWLGGEAFYSWLWVRRPPDRELENDGLFNVRALLRYRIQ